MLSISFVAASLFAIRSSKVNWYVKTWGLAFGALFSFLHLYQRCWSFQIINQYLSQDSISSSLLALTFWISLIIIVARQASVKDAGNKIQSFSFFVLLLNFVLVLTFLLTSAVSFYFMFEASLIPTLLIILGWGSDGVCHRSGLDQP